MTQNQLAYLRLQEEQRSNLASESEMRRANLAKEAETYRANLVKEAETHRSNVAGENIDVSRVGVSRESNEIASDRNAIAEREVEVKEAKLPSEIALTEEKVDTEKVGQASTTVNTGLKIVDTIVNIGTAINKARTNTVNSLVSAIDAFIPF